MIPNNSKCALPLDLSRRSISVIQSYMPIQIRLTSCYSAKSPHLSVTIRAPSTLSLSKPFPVTSTLTHHPNPSGNPDNKPVTLDLEDTYLKKIVHDEIYPWLIMHRTPSGGLKELDDDHDTTCPPFDNYEGFYDRIPIAPENGFVSLAVGENVDVKVELRYTGYGVHLDEGEEYCLNFRGSLLRWWTFGSLEVRVSFLVCLLPLSSPLRYRRSRFDEALDGNRSRCS